MHTVPCVAPVFCLPYLVGGMAYCQVLWFWRLPLTAVVSLAVGGLPLSPLVNRTYVHNYFGSSSSSICISSVMLLATYTPI
jgi:hypothetical protein